MKECKKCLKIMALDQFGKDISKKHGLRTYCKKCIKAYNQKRSIRRIIGETKRCSKCTEYKPFNEFYKNTRVACGLSSKCKACIRKYRIAAISKKTKPSISTKKCSGKYGCSKVKRIECFDYRKDRKTYVTYCKDCRTKRYHKDIEKKLAATLRSRIRFGLKNSSAVKDLGCSISELKRYLEQRFYDSKQGITMGWNNYGYYGWHIDHIIPLARFDLADRNQFLKACHYTNLQPLWAEENFKKGANA